MRFKEILMMKTKIQLATLLVALAMLMPMAIQAEERAEVWLPSLITDTPQEGFELAIKLSRMGVKSTQSSKEVLFRERAKYSEDGEALMHASEVIAVHFQTVAAANDYWK